MAALGPHASLGWARVEVEYCSPAMGEALSLSLDEVERRISSLLSSLPPKHGERALELLRRLCEEYVEGGSRVLRCRDGSEWFYLERLLEHGLLVKVYWSRRDRAFVPVNPRGVLSLLSARGAASQREAEVRLPPDLFSCIEGYEDVKRLLRAAVASPRPVHVLLVGPPHTAKSLFLMELERVDAPKVVVLGSTSSKAGLLELLHEVRPRLVLIDEIDKFDDGRSLAALLSLMESGRVSKAVKGERWSLQLDARVVAAANSLDRLPRELVDRFLVLKFRPYTEEEFVRVCTSMLTRLEGLPRELAEEVARRALREGLGLRQARHIARLVGAGEDLDWVVQTISRYK